MRQSVLVRVNPNRDGNWRKAAKMYEGRVTEVLEKLLVTRGDISRPVGTGKLGMKGAGGSGERADRQVMADAVGGDPAPAYGLREGGQRSPIRLIVNNTSMRQTARSTASLTVVR